MKIKVMKSKRKTMSLSVDDELNTVVKAPLFVSDKQINDFITKNTIKI